MVEDHVPPQLQYKLKGNIQDTTPTQLAIDQGGPDLASRVSLHTTLAHNPTSVQRPILPIQVPTCTNMADSTNTILSLPIPALLLL